jgi:uncharacterized membrane protein YjjB (DUF3815 family)
VMYLLSSLALPVLDHRNSAKAPWWHLLIAAIATISTLWVASQASTAAYQMLGLISVVGTGLYFIAAKDTANKPD